MRLPFLFGFSCSRVLQAYVSFFLRPFATSSVTAIVVLGDNVHPRAERNAS